MKWEKCSTELSDILAAAMVAFSAQKRLMFGCPTYSVNGNMFTGVHQSDIFIRLAKGDRQSFLDSFDEAAPFEPVAGRIMKEYVVVPPAVYDNHEIFRSWLVKAIKYAAALPPKLAKPRAAKKEKSHGPSESFR